MSISNEAGVPPFDPAVIARLAKELFTALPGRSVPLPSVGAATPPLEAAALPMAPAIPPLSAVGPITEVEVRSLPATLSGATVRPPQAGLTPSAVLGPYDFRPELIPDPAVPPPPGGGVTLAPPVTPPVEVGALSTVPAFALPTEADLQALPATLVQPPPVASTPSAAAVPGSSFYFLDAAQSSPLSTTPDLPLGDYGFDPGMLPDLGITAGPYDPRSERGHFPIRA